MKEAMFYKREDGNSVRCLLCPNGCVIKDGGRGACFARKNEDGRLMSESFGILASIALDPIEKKPLKRFFPGSKILSIGSYGCNLHCGFCQNYRVSLSCAYESDLDFEMPDTFSVTPEAVAMKARELIPHDNIGVAYTYNEPLVGYEFVLECAKTVHSYDMKNVLVSNGYLNPEPLEALLPYIDAANIDLKSFEEDFYRDLGGRAASVKETIELVAKSCHLEVTTLVIPNRNDSEDEMRRISRWLAGINDEIPLHISKFTPRHRFASHSPTPRETVLNLVAIASENLKYVYPGNI